ncbi:hypothetical protein [Sutterella wadsworthensis]|jgi:hypothetical protein|uniref:hypothetical protein n=1 Tax=Sutterella wadsworthensis TaxID=40545 RepID=UPI0013F668B0|nr:hypothetical protein [Sutterella wadsworthensis]
MISTEIRRSQTYVGTGDVNSYTFPFRVFAADQVKVYVRAADAASGTLLDTTQYSVTLASASAQTVGGTVTLSAPLAAGAKLVILSNIPYTQLLALQNQGAFNAEDLNAAWDKNTALSQQLLDRLDRAVLAPELGDRTPEQFTQALFDARDEAVAKAGEAANSASASATSASDAAASAAAAASSAVEAEASKNAINVTKEQVTAEGRKQIAAIQTEGGTQISNVQSVGQEQASRISTAGSAVVADIKLNGQGEVDRITQTGGTWNDTVVATGQRWKQDVIAAGSDSLAKATAQAAAAEASANKASGFADAASAAAKAAETSENVAVSSATAAGVSEAKAKASETAAASSKTAAAGSASAASQSAAAAATSATEAGGRAAAAAASASAAKSSQDAAAASAAAAKASEDKAKEYANQASSGQIQADWTETDTAAKSYIKNKPIQLTSAAVSAGTATDQGTISAAQLKASIKAVAPAEYTVQKAELETGTAAKFGTVTAAGVKAAIQKWAPAQDLSGYLLKTDFTWAGISGKPTIPAAQVQTDWNATTGKGVLLNKPAQMTNAAAEAGTATAGCVISAATLKAAITTLAPAPDLSGYVATVNFTWANLGGKPTLGALASKDKVGPADIADGAIPADTTAAEILAAFTQFATENGIT